VVHCCECDDKTVVPIKEGSFLLVEQLSDF
jgi:hypothetical protein